MPNQNGVRGSQSSSSIMLAVRDVMESCMRLLRGSSHSARPFGTSSLQTEWSFATNEYFTSSQGAEIRSTPRHCQSYAAKRSASSIHVKRDASLVLVLVCEQSWNQQCFNQETGSRSNLKPSRVLRDARSQASKTLDRPSCSRRGTASSPAANTAP